MNLTHTHPELSLTINAHSGQKQPHNLNDNLQAKAKSGKYLIEKCQSEHYQQLFFKYYVKL